jgi:hypothetical protein
MKFITIILFFSFTLHAQNWTPWHAIDTLKCPCDPIKITTTLNQRPFFIFVDTLNWAYSDEIITYMNNPLGDPKTYWIKRQWKIWPQTGEIWQREMVEIKQKSDYQQIKDIFTLKCLEHSNTNLKQQKL